MLFELNPRFPPFPTFLPLLLLLLRLYSDTILLPYQYAKPKFNWYKYGFHDSGETLRSWVCKINFEKRVLCADVDYMIRCFGRFKTGRIDLFPQKTRVKTTGKEWNEK